MDQPSDESDVGIIDDDASSADMSQTQEGDSDAEDLPSPIRRQPADFDIEGCADAFPCATNNEPGDVCVSSLTRIRRCSWSGN